MQMTGRSDGDRVIAAAVALVVNGLIAWQLQALLSPQPMAVDAASASLQVVWITAVPRRAIVRMRRAFGLKRPCPSFPRTSRRRAR